MSLLTVAAGAAVMTGAALQSSIGFGFALVSAPLLFAATSPPEAVGLLIVLALEVSLLTLLTERRRPEPVWADVIPVVAFALPGALAGVAVLRALDAVTLQIAVSIGVAATLLVRRRAPAERSGPEPRWAAPLTGLSAGALVTSTNTSGPPLLLYLLGRGDDPERVRDTLTVCQLGLSVIGAAALVGTGTTEAVPGAGVVAALVPLVLLAHLAGRRVFARLAQSGHYEPVLNATLVAAVATGLVTAVL